MNNTNIEEKLKLFKEKFKREIKDTDWSSIYCDCDMLESVPEYISLIEIADKTDNKKVINEILKIEKSVIKENKLIKIVTEEGIGYYAKRGEPYDSDGNIIEGMFEEKLQDEDLFCNYTGDEIYLIMKRNIQNKIKEYENEFY